MEQGSIKTYLSLHFLTETKINRDHQRLLTMVRKTLGDYMGMGWNVFRVEPGTSITAGSLVQGLEMLAAEIRKLVKEPMEAYNKVCLAPSPFKEEYI